MRNSLTRGEVHALKKRLPEISSPGSTMPSTNDNITAQLRWVFHPNHDEDALRTLLWKFIVDRGVSRKKINSYDWNKNIYNAIVEHYDWWLAAEYFFLDELMRNPYQSTHFSFLHRKWPRDLDISHKVDLLSRLAYWEWKHDQHHVFGTQMYYAIMRSMHPDRWWTIHWKEKQNVEAIESWVANKYLESYLCPEIPCFIKLNSEYLQRNGWSDMQDKKIFINAFNKWSKEWFTWMWPSWYLPEKYKQHLGNMAHFYQRSCKSFIRFVYETYLHWNELMSYTARTEFDEALRINSYNAKDKRAQYDFYHKQWSKRHFMKISFRITQALESKFKDIVQ